MQKVVWKGNMLFEGENERGLKTTMDASPQHGGNNNGPAPMEVFLHSLGGCTGMDVISILRKMKEPVEEFYIEINAERAPEHPRVYTRVHLKYVFKGNLDPKKVKRAIELSSNKYCSVTAMLRKTAEVTYDYEIIPPE